MPAVPASVTTNLPYAVSATSMARTPRERFEREAAKITGSLPDTEPISDDAVRAALEAFIPAVDPERSRPSLPVPRPDGTIRHRTVSNRTGESQLRSLRLAHDRGLNLLGASADAVNDFMYDFVDGRLDEYDGTISKPGATNYQAALRNFYRFCTEPGQAEGRPDVVVEWPADGIHMFTERSKPRHDEADRFEDAEIDALREATVKTRNPRRDRAFLELVAGTGQRIYALVTLRVGDLRLEPGDGPPHILLNPAIRDDGDKGAIANAGRWRPIVSNPAPIREWIEHHPLRDDATRNQYGIDEPFEDCYAFIGDVSHPDTEPSQAWHETAAGKMLKRLKSRTESMPGVETVTKPVNVHNFRHWAYTKSKALDIDESDRRKVFGWAPGSDTGEETYGHTTSEEAGRRFAEQWASKYGAAESDPSELDAEVGQALRVLAGKDKEAVLAWLDRAE